MDIDKLRKTRETNFEKWFERWLNRIDLDKRIVISNEQGFTGYTINIDKQDERDKRMMLEPMFLNLLKSKYPQLEICIENKEVRNTFMMLCTKNTLIISWAE